MSHIAAETRDEPNLRAQMSSNLETYGSNIQRVNQDRWRSMTAVDTRRERVNTADPIQSIQFSGVQRVVS